MMTGSGRKFVLGVLLLVGCGGLIGWLYGQMFAGLMIAALLVLLWQIRQLLSFERALRTGNFDNFRLGEGIWQQISSRVRFERDRTIRHKAGYRALLREIRKSTDAMPDGAVILDANNEIIGSNRAAKSLAGLKRKKDKGQRIENILRAPEISALVNAADYGSNVEIPSPVDDGSWLNCRVVPYGGDQKLLLLRDVTERVRLSKMRRDFVANASHELRSPLTVISGYLDALADDEQLPEHWARPLGQMRDQAERMKQILGEMLELSRLESGGPASAEEAVDVAALLTRISHDYKRPGCATISVNIESSAELLGVRDEIESVVVNLLSNALRHTPEDGEVSLFWRSDADGAELVVSDTGEGIDADDLPRLTERFFRVDRGRSRSDGGVGLGLAIVKHVLVRHDAELVVESTLGSGSSFTCHFPPQRVVVAKPASLS
jgi:two-component system phosphate regulon sensor histidine kinase PhoR